MKKGSILLLILTLIVFSPTLGFVKKSLAEKNIGSTESPEKKQEEKTTKPGFSKFVVSFTEKPSNYRQIIKGMGGKITYDYRTIEAVNIEIPERNIKRLNQLRNVKKIRKPFKMHALLDVSVPQIHAPEVWLEGYDGAGVKVAIIDTGVDYEHPSLEGRIDSSDPTDCYHFLSNGTDVGLGCMDDYGHGTHCSGIVASDHSTYRGVAPEADLIAIKVLDSGGSGYDSDVAAAIDYAVVNGAKIISLSLGAVVDPDAWPYCYPEDPTAEVLCSCYDTVVSDAVDAAFDAGVVVVAASGNDSTIGELNAPACADNCISVGAVDSSDYIAYFSNGGLDLDLVAPGVDIISTWWGGDPGCGGDPDCWAYSSGTSMATPHIAGLAALLLDANPSLSPGEVREILRSSADDLGATGFDVESGYGRVNAYNAYQYTLPFPKNIEIKTFRDAYVTEEQFFSSIIYIQADISNAQGNPTNDADVHAEFYLNDILKQNISFDFIGSGVYRGSTTLEEPGVYDIKVVATNPYGSGEAESKIHIYKEGISAYHFPLFSDDNYILENKHLIVGFDISDATFGPLVYLRQKETSVVYEFKESSDENATNRGGLAGSKIPLKFIDAPLGENLSTATIQYEAVEITQTGWNPPLDPTDRTCANQWGSCYGCTNHVIDTCGTEYPNCSTESIDAIRIDKTVYAPGDQITVDIDFFCDYDFYETDGVAISYNDGSGWVNKWAADGGLFGGGASSYSHTFTLSNNPGTHYVRASIQWIFDAPYTCADGEAFGYTDLPRDNDDVSFTVASAGTIEDKILDLDIEMRNENSDYLIYKIYNFSQPTANIASDIFASFDNVDDDRFHIGDGQDGLISSLTPDTWNPFSSPSPEQRYITIYDNDDGDSVNSNFLGWINYLSTDNVDFDTLAVRSETGKEGAKIVFDTSQATESDYASYLLVFSIGDWNNIESKMSNIVSGILPEQFLNIEGILHLSDMPSYQKEKGHYSGAATAEMILDYIREGAINDTSLTQDEIYTYGHPLNNDTGILELDPEGMDAVLGHFDPYDELITEPYNQYDSLDGGNPLQGYNFTVDTYSSGNINDYMRDIAHWMAYPVTQQAWWLGGDLVSRPNTPAAVPVYGSYNNWVAINGFVASENPIPYPDTDPWYTPDFTVYGFWLTDPTAGGIGQHVYVTASEAESTYFLPLATGDKYDGKYLQVAEPPLVMSNANVEIAEPIPDPANLQFVGVETAEEPRMMALSMSDARSEGIEEKQSWRDLIEEHLLSDPEVVFAFDGARMVNPVFVHRLDNGSDYYLVPFKKFVRKRIRTNPRWYRYYWINYYLTSGVIMLDADDGHFKEASWTDEPVEYLPMTKWEAIYSVLRQERELRRTIWKLWRQDKVNAELVWEPSLSNSPFSPVWKVSIGDRAWFISQDSLVTNAIKPVKN